MCQKNDLSLSLSGEAFSPLRSDFDQVLRSTLAGMIDTEQDVAEISMKVKITLTEDSAPDFTVAGGQQTREITKPKFEHTVTAVIQRKEKKTGTFSGDYELVWDRESGRYVARPIDNGQTTLFDDNGSEIIEAEYHEVPALGEGQRGLPEPADEGDPQDGEVVPDDGEGGLLGASGEFGEGEVDPAFDTSKPFGWLRQFIGEEMHITEAMGNYTVRTNTNKVVLSSATGSDSPFYCPVEKLEPHVDHAIVCVGYGDDEIVNISIECEDCNEVLFSIDVPWLGDVGKEELSGDAEEDEVGEYEYENPEGDDGKEGD